MKLVIVIVSVVLLLLAAFAAANWAVLAAPTPLTFVAFDVEGPLGVILLGVTLCLTLLVVGYALLLRTSWLVETRHLNRRLDEQRDLAQRAEMSRFVALQESIELRFAEVHTSLEKHNDSGVARIESAVQHLAKTIEENTNSIVANIGYLDDKLKGGS